MKSTSSGATISNEDLVIFFSEYSLYRKIEYCVNLSSYHSLKFLEDFEQKAFQFYCPIDKDERTFKLNKPELPGYFQVSPNEIPHIYLDKNSKLNISFPLNAHCQFCNFKMNFLINAFTEEQAQYNPTEFPTIYIRKVGQYPAPEIKPEKIFKDFLTNDDLEFYKRAKQNLSFSYGIGAFAYFRRIVENEIINIADNLSKTDANSKTIIEQALKAFQQNHQMKRLIESLTSFLPKNILIDDENPLIVLYASISDGIHNLSENQCLERAVKIEKLLRFVINELRNSEAQKEARQALKELRNS